jgi:hypothetical protein
MEEVGSADSVLASGLGWGLVAGSCEDCNEPFDSIKDGKFLD